MNDTAWRVLESATEYETGWYDGGYDLVEQPDGSTKRYYWADLPPAVVVVPILEDEVVFVEQYRPTIRTACLELPAGIVEPGETYRDAASRELEEETGYTAEKLETIQRLDVATGVLRHERGITVAQDLSPGEATLDSNEFLTVETVPIERAIDVARDQPANDATLEGVLLAKETGVL
ncbi:MAG: NUDIX hydrolase [Halodesulfurarchaeum sp.]